MKRKVKIKINNENFEVPRGISVLEAAEKAGFAIPRLCFHPDLEVKANCRVCVVEIKGQKRLLPSCATKVEEGMEILTDSPRVEKSRKMNLELIYAEHIEKCPTCPLRTTCSLLKYARDYGLKITRFSDRKANRLIHRWGKTLELDATQCIDCRNCLDVCKNKQGIDFFTLKNRGADIEVTPRYDQAHSCVFCGQCSLVCPVTAAQENLEYIPLLKELQKKKKKFLALVDPIVLASLPEISSLNFSSPTEALAFYLKKIGFDWVVTLEDVFGLLFISEKEAWEEKFQQKQRYWVSFCGAFKNLLQLYYPYLLKELTPILSPALYWGKFLKKQWAKKEKVKAEELVVVSFTPCMAQKRKVAALKEKGKSPLHYVLTIRELRFLLERHKLDSPPSFSKSSYTSPFSLLSVSGGSAELIFGKKIKWKKKSQHSKEAKIKKGRREARLIVINSLKEARGFIENKEFLDYDYIEVMSCPGGCLGGGGQLIPTTPLLRQKRKKRLRKLLG